MPNVSSLQQVSVARELGADGIFLIDHNSAHPHHIDDAFLEAREEFPEFPIGVNYLQFRGALAGLHHIRRNSLIEPISTPDMLWVDDIERAEPGCTLHGHELFAAITEPRLRDTPAPLLLGGVAFKYTANHTEDPQGAVVQAKKLQPYLDVLVTSGPATGAAASPEKLKAIRSNFPAMPIALASGVTDQNVTDYPDVDIFMVSSSVETQSGSGIFDQAALSGLIAVVKNMRKS
jgi:hypothetical protein